MNQSRHSKQDDRDVENISSNIINAYDLAGIEDMDPALADGFKVVFDKELPLELRLQEEHDEQEAGLVQAIRARVLSHGDIQKPNAIKIELSSENDLFFHYSTIIDPSVFSRMKQDQKLNVDYNGFLNLVLKMFTSCQKEPQGYQDFSLHNINSFFAVLFMHRDGLAKLDFVQNMEYKFLELLTIEMAASSEEVVRGNISYRYAVLKAKDSILQNRLKDVSAILKLKNPSLLLQLHKDHNPKPLVQRNTNVFH